MAIPPPSSTAARAPSSIGSTGFSDARTLVIETATAACSVALVAHGEVIAARHEVVGRGHAERLVPMIAELPGRGQADRILVDCGPGSFTGVRVGLAAAIGLGIGWRVPVAGYSSMALVAVAGFAREGAPAALAVVLEGGHGEVFMQRFTASPFAADGPLRSLRPEAAAAQIEGVTAIGSGAHHLAALMPGMTAQDALPDAAQAVLLPAEYTSLPPRPIYGRAPDAKVPEPRR